MTASQAALPSPRLVIGKGMGMDRAVGAQHAAPVPPSQRGDHRGACTITPSKDRR